jgi:hypothetical protein
MNMNMRISDVKPLVGKQVEPRSLHRRGIQSFPCGRGLSVALFQGALLLRYSRLGVVHFLIFYVNAVTSWTAWESVSERERKVTGWLSGYTSVIDASLGVFQVYRLARNFSSFDGFALVQAGCRCRWLVQVTVTIGYFVVKVAVSWRPMPAASVCLWCNRQQVGRLST